MDYCSSKNQAKPSRRATGAGVKPKLSHRTLDTVKSQASGWREVEALQVKSKGGLESQIGWATSQQNGLRSGRGASIRTELGV